MSQVDFYKRIIFRQNRPSDCTCGGAMGRERGLVIGAGRSWGICREESAAEGASCVPSGIAPTSRVVGQVEGWELSDLLSSFS